MSHENYHPKSQMNGLEMNIQTTEGPSASSLIPPRFMPFDAHSTNPWESQYLQHSSNLSSRAYEASQMTGSPTPTTWSGTTHLTASFDEHQYYEYSPVDPAAAHGGGIFPNVQCTDIPRTWQLPCDTRIDGDSAVGPHSYLIEPSGQNMQVLTTHNRHSYPAANCFPSLSQSPDFEGYIPTSSNSPATFSPDTFVRKANGTHEVGELIGHEASEAEYDELNAEEPYAKLIYRALMSAPAHSMVLQDIYSWFRENTIKGSSDSKGWMNSIRHNLSMNAAFKKTERKVPGDESKKFTEWVLEDFAIKDGVQSTTRYRKGASVRKTLKSELSKFPSTSSSKTSALSSKAKQHRQTRSQERFDSPKSTQRSSLDMNPLNYSPPQNRHNQQRHLPSPTRHIQRIPADRQSPLLALSAAESLTALSTPPYFFPIHMEEARQQQQLLQQQQQNFEELFSLSDFHGVNLEDPLVADMPGSHEQLRSFGCETSGHSQAPFGNPDY